MKILILRGEIAMYRNLFAMTALSASSSLFAATNPLSVHILNQQNGLPAADVTVVLEAQQKTSGSKSIRPKRIRMDVLRRFIRHNNH